MLRFVVQTILICIFYFWSNSIYFGQVQRLMFGGGNIRSCYNVKAELVETTFVRSGFLDIRHGYDFVPSRIQKKRSETTVV